MSGGPRKSLRRQIPLLAEHPAVDRLDVFLPWKSQNLENWEVPIHSWPPRDWMKGFATLRSRVLTLKPDVIFIPNGNWFDTGGIPVVCMVRNAEPLLRPFGSNSLMQGIKNLLRARYARRSCLKSERVIAVSAFVKGIIAEKWNISTDKIGVVPHGVDPPDKAVRPDVPPDVEEGEFWFTAGSLVPYRGLEDLVLALSTRPVGEKLLIAGKPVYSTAYKEKLCRLAVRRGVSERIYWLGHISPAEMSWCFGESKAFIMTSRIEACPNILLESLAAGALSISSANLPMPEFYADTALYYNAGNCDELARKMELVSGMDRKAIEGRSTAARDRSELFSWTQNVDEIVGHLKLAAEKGG